MARFELACLAALALAALFVVGATEAQAASCPNEAIREQQSSTALPECRAYEQVSPSDKNGNSVGDVLRVSSDGEGIAWTSNGAYADPIGSDVQSAYVARRTGANWATKAFYPAYDVAARPEPLNGAGGLLFPADLSQMVFTSPGSLDSADQDHFFAHFGATDVYSIDATGKLSWLSRGEGFTANSPISAQVEGLSEDGSTAFLSTTEPLTPDVPNDSTARQLYRWRNGHLEAVGRSESGGLLEGDSFVADGSPGVASGNGEMGRLRGWEAVSTDGSRFFYGGALAPGGVSQIYFHEDGQAPKLVSASQRTGTAGEPADQRATFVSATPDLRKVYFVCHSQLTDDAPAGGGAYVYDTVTGVLEFSNPDRSDIVNPFELNTSGLVKMSANGSYRYFVETADLAPGAVEGEPNLYVQHGGARRYIGPAGRDLAVTAQGAGNPRYPSGVVAGLSDDGTRFVFQSAEELTGANTAGHKEVYLYDASEASLACISCRSDGSVSEADSGLEQKEISAALVTSQVLTPDGRGVFFTSGDRLLAADRNNTDDVYEWRDGTLSLISSGQSNEPSTFVGMGPDGRDVYFKTSEALTRSDTDGGLIDIYDARVDGGFNEPPPASPCASEGCQGTPSSAPVLSTPAAAAGGNGPNTRRSHARCKARRSGSGKAGARKSASSCAKKKKQRKHKSKQAKKARQAASGELRTIRKGR